MPNPLRRRAPLLVGAAAALLFAGSVGIALQQAVQQYKLETQTQRISVWYSSQALVELHRTRSVLLRMGEPDSDDADETLLDRYEILLSRVALMTPENVEAAEALYGRLDMVAGLLQSLEGIEGDILGFRPGDAAARARIGAVLDAAEQRLTRLNVTLHTDRAEAVTRAQASASRLSLIFTACILGIALSSALLMVLLRRGMRRAEETERTLRVLVEALPVAVTAVDTDGRVVLANGAARDMFALPGPDQKLIGRSAAEIGAAPWLQQDAAAVLAAGEARGASEREVATPDGGRRTLITSAAPVLAAGNQVVRVVSVGLDVSERREADARIRFLAEHDVLTGLPNRVLFAERLREALAPERLRRMVAVHCLDLDDFKGVNDSLGHPVGDQLLVAAATRMASTLRAGDVLARLGGDEFAVIQPDIAGPEEAAETAARLVQALGRPFCIAGYTLRSGGSVGTALAPLHGMTAEALLQRADIALYRAKSGGRGRSMLFTADQEERLVERRRLEEDLHQAVQGRQMVLAYQPKFRLRDGGLDGVEALLRWQHPERGWIPPGLFIPVAEETGLIHKLTRFVLEEACRQALRWRAEGLEVPVAVNLSAAEFGAGQGTRLVQEALEATGGDPRLLEVEVTEGVFLRKAERAAAEVAALRRLGVRVALDDFGTGYSSLGYLQHLPFDVIKVDRQFVDRIEEAGPSLHIVDAVIRLAHGLSAKVVAEGVERRGQLQALAELGCDQAQGFLLSRPLAAEALPALIARRRPGQDVTKLEAA
ncbi:diguanylate cyclase [Falsiroseomonas bella]|uniref:Diguanylate cyclase n=1 Tax=Falsiroseomonas bella TaxID=2184016 RepID=A0A317FC52_9PROT|nr:GGDEF and EAL domain-containing protein [Falsiroseomonas bella]PWS35519.1 diguanylate cyclase [Falsiroseomonas bella]